MPVRRSNGRGESRDDEQPSTRSASQMGPIAPVPRSDLAALRAVYAELSHGNFAAMLPLLDPDVEWRWTDDQSGLTGDDSYRGVAAVSRAMASWLRNWDSFAVDAEDFIESGDRIIVLVRLRARPRSARGKLISRQADIYTFRGGRIVTIENAPCADSSRQPRP